ncbi:MAG: hypothetical protein Q8N03_04610 [Ignavibacteria bacterium]|nr:hypothetical protein [Ignavibacteria bacterium]MDP3830887.1 hypothetical protein [Ignavibacteriaceae bacterium]
MNLTKGFFPYISLFLILPIVLKLFGFISLSYSVIFSFVLLLSGLGIVFLAFNSDRRLALFLGTQLFFAGIFISLTEKFLFNNVSNIYLPAFLLSVGFGFLFLFWNEVSAKTFLYAAVGLIFTTLILIFNQDSFGIINLYDSFIEITEEFWLFILLAGLAFTIYLLDKRKTKPADS